MTTVDPNIILVNVLATIGVVKAILWLLEDEEDNKAPRSSKNEESAAPQNNNKHNNKIKPLRMSKRILGMLHDEDDKEEAPRSSKNEESAEEDNRRPVPRWIRIIQEEAEDLPGSRASRSPKDEEGGEESIEVYLYAICICVSIILSIIILR